MPADEISQAERRRVLANDRRVLATYHGVAQTSADDDRGGRFAAVSPTRTVVGAAPISYPKLPANSPWACDPVPTEPPLGFSVDAMEPVGELHERGDAAEAGLRRRGWRRL
jgi:hypothetical protein